MERDTTLLPARGSDTAEILMNDHDVIKSLLADLVAPNDPRRRRDTLEQLKGVLTIHNATEENLVYPALEKVAGKKMESQHLYHETAEADVLIFELDTMLKEGEDDGTITDKAEKLQDAITHHIEKEEQSALPHLRDGSQPQESQMLTNAVREFRNALKFEPVGV